MQKSGIIMEIQEKQAIILTKDGQFLRIGRTPNMFIGKEIQEVSWLSIANSANGHKRFLRRRSSRWYRFILAGTAACLALALSVWHTFEDGPPKAEAYAFVSLDVNPSVSLTVDERLDVLNAVGLNHDGIVLLSKLHIKGEPLKTAINTIISAVFKAHMLPQGDSILVAAAPAGPHSDAASVREEAAEDLNQALKQNDVAGKMNARVYSVSVPQNVWKTSVEAHVSPAKLAAYAVAKQEGLPVNPNQLQGSVLGSIFKNEGEVNQIVDALGSQNPSEVEDLVQSLKDGLNSVLPTPAYTTSSQTQTSSFISNTHGKSASDSSVHPEHGAGNGDSHQNKHEEDNKGDGTTFTGGPLTLILPGVSGTEESNQDNQDGQHFWNRDGGGQGNHHDENQGNDHEHSHGHHD